MIPSDTEVAAEMTRNLDTAEGAHFDAAHAYGFGRAEAGAHAADVVREVMAAVPELTGRLREVAIEAVARAVGGWEEQRRDRREAWLSFLVHDLKNPLNTVLNALWLLRGKLDDREDVTKLLGMVERAARKIEQGLGDVRELERHHVVGLPVRRK
jgi:signal transduction histidine kinase